MDIETVKTPQISNKKTTVYRKSTSGDLFSKSVYVNGMHRHSMFVSLTSKSESVGFYSFSLTMADIDTIKSSRKEFLQAYEKALKALKP